MSEDLAVRRYVPADADRVWAVHEAAFRASPIEFVECAPMDDDLRNVRTEYLDADGEFLVGALDREASKEPTGDDSEIVAVGGFLPDGDAVELKRMRVHPDHQGRGFGRRLLDALETRAVERDFDVVTLHTHEKLVVAQGLYESHGYDLVDRSEHPETGDVMLGYRKSLREGDD